MLVTEEPLIQTLGCVNWLIDDEKADFVTGITVPVDGGFLSDSGL